MSKQNSKVAFINEGIFSIMNIRQTDIKNDCSTNLIKSELLITLNFTETCIKVLKKYIRKETHNVITNISSVNLCINNWKMVTLPSHIKFKFCNLIFHSDHIHLNNIK